MRFKLLLILFVYTISQKGNAQLEFSGEFRPRTEFRGGYKTPISKLLDMAVVTDQRTRLIANYRKSNVEFNITAQDVRIWGNTPTVGGNGGFLGIAESWLRLDINPQVDVCIGRQAISLDNERIFGALNWAQAGQFHDAIRLNIRSDQKSSWRNHLSVLGSINQSSSVLSKTRFSTNGSYKGLAAAHYLWNNETKGIKGSMLSSLVMYPTHWHNLWPPGDTHSLVYGIGTHGVTSRFKRKSMAVGFEGYIQHKTNTSEVDFLAAISLSKAMIKTSITLGTDYLSSGFKPLFGTNHKFYGFMDYYYVGNSHQNKGLFNPYFRIDLKTTAGKFSLFGHHFRSAVNIPTGNDWQSMGEELDILWSKQFSNSIHLLGGWSVMRTTSFLNEIKNQLGSPRIQTWGFLQLTYKLREQK
jgi:hypothetical protein